MILHKISISEISSSSSEASGNYFRKLVQETTWIDSLDRHFRKLFRKSTLGNYMYFCMFVLECNSPHLPLKAVNLQFSFSVDKTEALHKQSSLQISSSSSEASGTQWLSNSVLLLLLSFMNLLLHAP